MIEPFSIASGLVGLFKTCRDCYTFFSDVANADKSAAVAISDFQLQGDVLASWGAHWEMSTDSGDEDSKPSDKFARFIKDDTYAAGGVRRALKAVADALSDQEQLLNRFGIKLKAERTDKNEALHLLCPKNVVESMYIRFADRRLELCITPDSLRHEAALMESSKSKAPPEDASELLLGARYDLLKDLAELKAQAKEDAETFNERQSDALQKLITMEEKDFSFQVPRSPSDLISTLAIYRGSHIVLIEFKSYVADNGFKCRDIQADVLKLGRLLLGPRTTLRLGAMHCLGLLKNTDSGYISFVHSIPAHLRKSGGMVPLGWRFEAARQLLRNVILLHAAGWLHKNIRAESIIMFPDDRAPLTRGVINWGQVFLMGYGFSRSQAASAGNMKMVAKNIKLDVYHHPEKRINPNRLYQPAYDLYSLGIVLLELGLWRRLETMVSSDGDAYQVREYILSELQPQLVGKCGEVYADVDKALLKAEHTESGSKTQREEVLSKFADLGRCYA
ncbi:hypothetical protein AOQ84DRAFT_224031 [Glonium stellatum]|uniref:Protein kinase domain-containing protein n=1 Tax=Glonium stellatum TaxID=574774 RepID=A0A8E2JQT2_9PEZI|nr:hypothetical protein AOQ84DRAFT_224031 [Glonium stellatum]